MIRSPRRLVAALVVGSAAVTLAGCGAGAAALKEREAVVVFKPDTPKDVRLRVRSDCAAVPRVTPQPLPTQDIRASQVNDVRFRVDDASDADLARLYQCLRKHPSVVGVDLPQDNDS